MVIGIEGGMDITVDEYTKAKAGKIRIVLNFYCDAVAARPTAFSVRTFK